MIDVGNYSWDELQAKAEDHFSRLSDQSVHHLKHVMKCHLATESLLDQDVVRYVLACCHAIQNIRKMATTEFPSLRQLFAGCEDVGLVTRMQAMICLLEASAFPEHERLFRTLHHVAFALMTDRFMELSEEVRNAKAA